MNLIRPKISSVFTPRSHQVNKKTYINRPDLEKELKRKLDGTMHVVLYGESGSGKSWLYKKVLADEDAKVFYANCANASRFNSLAQEITNSANIEKPKKLEEISEGIDAQLSAMFAKGGGNSSRRYKIASGDPLLELFKLMRASAKNRTAVLVIDNLEMIFDDANLMAQLASMITLLDDSRYAEYSIKFLIVGIPSNIKDYFDKIDNRATVSNRLVEVSEVQALDETQVFELVEKGFIGMLRVDVPEKIVAAWQKHICRVTLGFALAVQEYCETLAYLVEDNDWAGNLEQLNSADSAWLKLRLEQGLS